MIGSGRTRRRAMCQGLALLAVAPHAAACGSSGPPATARAPREQAPISLMTDWSSGTRLKNLESGLAILNEKYPNILVEVRHEGSMDQKLPATIAAGTQADAVLFHVPGIVGLRQHFADLIPFIKRDRFNMKDWLDIDPGLLIDGGQYGMPFQYKGGAWFVNKTMFKREGVPLPTETWTWDDMAQASRRLTRPGEQWGLEFANGQIRRLSRNILGELIWSNGGSIISRDQRRTTLTTPEALEAGRWLMDRVHRDRVVVSDEDRKKVVSPGQNMAFHAGRVAMMMVNIGGVGGLANQVRDQFEWDVMWPPKAPRTKKAVTVMTDQPHAMTKNPQRTAAQADTTWVLISFLSGPEMMDILAEGRSSVPVHRTVLNSERYLRQPPETMPQVPKMVANSRFEGPYVPDYDEWRNVLNARLLEAWEGTRQIDDAMRAAAAEGDNVLAAAAVKK